VRAEDAADEGGRDREPAHKRAQMMEGAAGGEPTDVGRREEEPGEPATQASANDGGSSRRGADRRWAA
jgi:hypothetical protein